MQGIRCIDDGAVDKGDLRIWVTMVKELVGAAEPLLASITTICLCIYFKVELDGVGRDSEDKVKFPEGYGPAEVRVIQREITSPFRGSTNILSVKHQYKESMKVNMRSIYQFGAIRSRHGGKSLEDGPEYTLGANAFAQSRHPPTLAHPARVTETLAEMYSRF